MEAPRSDFPFRIAATKINSEDELDYVAGSRLPIGLRAAAGVMTLFLWLPGWGWGQGTQSQTIAAPNPPKVKAEFYTAKDRQDAIRKAAIYTPKAVSTVDIMAGPSQKKNQFQFHLNDNVTCDFVSPGQQLGGNTPKFLCKITRVESSDGKVVQTLTDQMDEEPLKIKFGADNREVYAEIVSSRLLWALGFYTDAWYAIRVVCNNCPADPEAGTGAPATRVYPQASTVRKFAGHKMYESGNEDEGWSWKELEDLNGRPSYEKDGLKLMAAFISHSDNKPPQQRLACDDATVDSSTNPPTTTCNQSRMVVQDVGSTFGGGGLFTGSGAKMDLKEWSNKDVWKKVGAAGSTTPPPQCQAVLHKSLAASGGLDDPMISEEGRRLVAGLLCQLSDQQIADMFKLSRAAEMPENHNGDGSFKNGQSEDSIVQDWVTAFKQKREDVAKGRCQWTNQPADLSVIDNPAGLASIPNFCTAKPF